MFVDSNIIRQITTHRLVLGDAERHRAAVYEDDVLVTQVAAGVNDHGVAIDYDG